MRFFIVNTDYSEFLRDVHARKPELRHATFAAQQQVRFDGMFGVADFYGKNLRALGHQAVDVIGNDPWMQAAWAREHGLRAQADALGALAAAPRSRLASAAIAQLCRFVLRRQIEDAAPDVVVNLGADSLHARVLRRMAPRAFLVGQHAANPLFDRHLDAYDLFVSSFPPTLEHAARSGVRTALLHLAFEPAILERIVKRPPLHDVVFVGQLAADGVHASRTRLLERLASTIPLRVFAPSVDALDAQSPLRRCWGGPAWGVAAYQAMADARVSLNHHGDVPPFANNMRLYEATGVGSALLTEERANLPTLFAPGVEVATYADDAGCPAAIRRLLDDEPARARMARAGQQRTLAAHTYRHRMQELVGLVDGSTGRASYARLDTP